MKPALFLATTAVLAVLAGCAKHAEPKSGAAPNLPPAKVRLAVVRTEATPALTEVTGTVRPVRRATIAAKLMGVIEEMPVTLGQRVKAGDVLVKINAGEIPARVAQAQSQLNQVQRDLARERDLLTKNASTSDMVKGLEDRLAMTQAMMREAEVMVGYMTVRAPFDAVVARKPAHAGDLAAPGQPLLELEGLGEFQIEAGIPDSAAASLAAGAMLAVEVPAAGATFAAQLVELSPSSDAYARTVVAKLSVPAGTTVRSGQFARVQVPGTAVRSLLAPTAAVSTLGQMERVFIAGEGNRATLRLVKTGATRGDRIEILSGLADGDRIVVAPPVGLREGQPLEVQP
jgi:RND family efflux transporter MFP subunit